jgi:hypothetical protein
MNKQKKRKESSESGKSNIIKMRREKRNMEK